MSEAELVPEVVVARRRLIVEETLEVGSSVALHHVLERIADHPINRIEDLLPWNVSLASTHTVTPK